MLLRDGEFEASRVERTTETGIPDPHRTLVTINSPLTETERSGVSFSFVPSASRSTDGLSQFSAEQGT